MKKGIKWILRIILWGAFLSTIYFVAFGIPRFIHIFSELGVTLPLLTWLVINLRYLFLFLLLVIIIGLTYFERKYSFSTSIIILCGGIFFIGLVSAVLIVSIYLPLFGIGENIK